MRNQQRFLCSRKIGTGSSSFEMTRRFSHFDQREKSQPSSAEVTEISQSVCVMCKTNKLITSFEMTRRLSHFDQREKSPTKAIKNQQRLLSPQAPFACLP
nr:hypothetical protein [Algoriphagus locisalis]